MGGIGFKVFDICEDVGFATIIGLENTSEETGATFNGSTDWTTISTFSDPVTTDSAES